MRKKETKRDQVQSYVFLDQNIAINHTLACSDEFVKDCSLIDFTAPKISIIIMSRLVFNVYHMMNLKFFLNECINSRGLSVLELKRLENYEIYYIEGEKKKVY